MDASDPAAVSPEPGDGDSGPVPAGPEHSGGGPVVVGANWYRFRPAEHIHHAHVMSTSFVWVVQGSGVIRSGDREFRMTSHSILCLPWRHEVEYRADVRSPFQLGTIHVVPWHDASVPVTPRVAFAAGDPLLEADFRRGPHRPGDAILLPSSSTTGRNVITLATYAVERFISAPFSETVFRSLGALILEESAAWSPSDPVTHGTPTVLQLMTDFIVENLERRLSVPEIAEAGGCSTTTAERLFATHTGLSVQAWARNHRMHEAALLLRTSGLRANEVARRVGFSDPLHFSRVFRATYYVPPSRYAAVQLRP
jgi:AraC-like DNA-binding protein